jgi:uncharacterized protein YceK
MRLILVGSAVLLLASGCSSIFGLDRRAIVLPIAEVEAPSTAAPGTSFSVAFTAVMTNGCIQFERLESTKTDGALTVTARGSVPTRKDIMCTQDVRSETVVEVVTPPTTDPFSIVATQPNGTATTVQVRIQ